jgi:energy-coupling factor transporter ATP-binding protein EcfA2
MSETVFMVMPFGDEISMSAYRHSTKPIVKSFGFRIQRADEIFSANPIFDDIVTAIEQSSIVIVDISNKNANCFYELGVAHTLKRNRTIMITHDEYTEVPDLPPF